jgi:methylated-DNA-[protein]-cysteine S-methyltransferase
MIVEAAQPSTPIGTLAVFVREGALVGVAFDGRVDAIPSWIGGARGAEEIRVVADPSGWTTRLSRYFDGDMKAFDGAALALAGTGFQREVWNALLAIPTGTTLSYGELARRIGRPDAMRAVGAANGANPVPIVVPCHRVVASDGSLHGYGGGLDRKRWLLSHEAHHAGAQRALGFTR